MKLIALAAITVALAVACAPAPAPTPAPVAPPAPTTTTPITPTTSSQPIKLVPSSYSISPADSRYPDETQKQLLDGILGDDIFNKNLSGTQGFEWVGWNQSNATMTFQFSGSKKITLLSIGVNRNDGAGIGLPTRVLINGKAFAVSSNSVQNIKRGFLTFSPDITSDTVTVVLERSDRNWLFVDEVLFEGN